jgi:very-short-patch-repair endonuclease
VGVFVLDFYCEERRLAIEIDGEIHNVPSHAGRDRLREQIIADHGIRFLRVSTNNVESDIERVIALIEAAVGGDQ